MSAFDGIVAFNRVVDAKFAKEIREFRCALGCVLKQVCMCIKPQGVRVWGNVWVCGFCCHQLRLTGWSCIHAM